MEPGYFDQIKSRAKKAIDENFPTGNIISVKNVRKAMQIEPGDRSMIVFLSRILAVLENEGALKKMEGGPPRRYVNLGLKERMASSTTITR